MLTVVFLPGHVLLATLGKGTGRLQADTLLVPPEWTHNSSAINWDTFSLSLHSSCFSVQLSTCLSKSRGGPKIWSKGWSTSPIRTGWDSWDCSAWRCSGKTFWQPTSTKRAYEKGGEQLFTRACSDKTRRNGFKLKDSSFRLDIKEILYCDGWWDTGTGCPKKLWMPHSWKQSRPGWMGP